MKFNLGYMDKYPIEAAGSTIENNPMYKVTFVEIIDPIKLESAIKIAFVAFPHFKTSVEFDKEYYLRTNENNLLILNCKEEDRPKTFGKSTNRFPWRMCYFERTLCFEWLHGVTDGMGALNFLKAVLLAYYDQPIEKKDLISLLAPGLEPFFDKDEKGKDFKQDPKGFSIKKFPKIKKRGYKTDCHSLVGTTKEIVDVAHSCKSSVAPVIAVLFSQALRLNLPKNIKNKNVACNIVLDLRRSLNYDTIHNCVDYKRITYLDAYDKMNFSSTANVYKQILDNARIRENVVRAVTNRVRVFKLYHILPYKWFLKFCVKLVGIFSKDSDCNFVFTYPGKIDLDPSISNKIENIEFKVWHDFGECIMAAVDYNGKFNLNISENFVNKNVVKSFIELSSNVGIHWEEKETSVFEQAHFEE